MNDVVNVQTTAYTTYVTTLTGANTINVGTLAPKIGGLLSGIQGALIITGTTLDTLNLDDTGSLAGANEAGVMAATSANSTINGFNMGTAGGTNSITSLASLPPTLPSVSPTIRSRSRELMWPAPAAR